MLGSVLDGIDADRFIRPRTGDEGPIGGSITSAVQPLSVAGFPNDEAAAFGFSHGQRRADEEPDAYSSAGSV
jgi:hypothetical protein